MAIATRLTRRLGITHPILSAPMDIVSGGKLAAAVTTAGGLGLIGGGYADDPDWLEREFSAAGNQAVGCGFITWALRKSPHLLDVALAHKPRAIFRKMFWIQNLFESDPSSSILATRDCGKS